MINAKSDLETWLAWLAERHTTAIHLGLERIRIFAEQLQLNTFACPVITVAGTNGKGTTVEALRQLYSSAGYRVGAYFSPHLHHFCERIVLNNQVVKEADLCETFAFIAEQVGENPLTFFEFITLAALQIFKNQPLDVLLLEVGLGGRLDAVNCVENDCAIVTQVALDHCDRLGSDRESIGAEKAGIFRQNKIAICGDRLPPQSLLDVAAKQHCDFYQFGKDFNVSSSQLADHWTWSTENLQLNNLPKAKIPQTSIACALMASVLLDDRLPVSDEDRREMVECAQMPGRFEVVQDRCPYIFDVAHNEAAALLLAEQLDERPCEGKTRAVFSHLADKEAGAILSAFEGRVDEWHVIPLDTPRAAKTAEIVQQITGLFQEPCYNHPDLASLFEALQERVEAQDRVLVFGSFHTVAAVQSELSARRMRK